MNKILIEIYLPASGLSYEMRIPRQLTVGRVKKMIVNFLTTKENREYTPTDDSILCDGRNGSVISNELYIDQLGLADGARLILI